MKREVDTRGSLVTEFAYLVPMLIAVTLAVTQILILLTQRSNYYAVADRIAFIAATTSLAEANYAANQIKLASPNVASIKVSKVGAEVKVTIEVVANLLVPRPEVKYQLTTALPIEP